MTNPANQRLNFWLSPLEQRWQERKLGTLPVTPVYDVVIRVVPISIVLPPQYENGNLIAGSPARCLDSLQPETRFFLKTAMRYASQKTETGEPYYEWEKQGWPNGIFISEKLERVIKAVQENDPTLRIGVLVDRSYNDVEKVEKPISFELCVPLSGGSPHKIVSMRGKSASMNVHTLVQGAERYRIDGFESIEPFKTYSREERTGGKGRYFAHFADLVPHDDTGWSTLFGFFVGANKRPRAISSCGADGSQYFFHTGKTGGKKMFAYAPYGGGIAFLHSISGFVPAPIALHEMAHSFAGLEDNYRSGFDITLYYANCAAPGREPHWGSVTRSRAFGGDGFYYGDRVKGCSVSGQSRPSGENMMCGAGGCIKSNSYAEGTDEFDVVSCGYLRTAIGIIRHIFVHSQKRVVAGGRNARRWRDCAAIGKCWRRDRPTVGYTAKYQPTPCHGVSNSCADAPDSGETVNLILILIISQWRPFADDGSISAEILSGSEERRGKQNGGRLSRNKTQMKNTRSDSRKIRKTL